MQVVGTDDIPRAQRKVLPATRSHRSEEIVTGGEKTSACHLLERVLNM